ncbi:MAG: hypothetical protein ABIF84_01580 [Patescibacteria group bacterium]
MTKKEKNIETLILEYIGKELIYVLEHDYDREDKAFKEAIEKGYGYIDNFNIYCKKFFIDKSILKKLVIFDANEDDFLEYFGKFSVSELILKLEGVKHRKITINETFEAINEGHIIIDYQEIGLWEKIFNKINYNFVKGLWVLAFLFFIFVMLEVTEIITVSDEFKDSINSKMDRTSTPVLIVCLVFSAFYFLHDKKQKKKIIKQLSSKERKELERERKKRRKLDLVIWTILAIITFSIFALLIFSYLL